MINNRKTYWLYVLKLEQNKYYIGVTSQDVSRRLDQHKHGFMGAKWTKKYKPIKVIDKKNLGKVTFREAEAYETRVTLKYMQKYGKNNVRGGLLSSEEKYIYRFGRFFTGPDYLTLCTVTLLLLIILYLGLKYYLK